MECKFTLNNGCELCAKGYTGNSRKMLPVTDWLADLPENIDESDLVEVQFKNTRKGYYHNSEHLPLEKGMSVTVEANPGYDIGQVTLMGRLVARQMERYHIDLTRYEIRNIYRVATEQDLQKREEAKAKEQQTMIRARALAKDLGLQMKIGDVEYQGDGTKAIFYYIADERVDFRQLIKVYAETFRIRIEMKQIGARQEAGRIGGTGPCGRELCCSTWLTQFRSVNTGAARIQNLSLNPQKLAGQCAKLKCCLAFELPVYEEAMQNFPDRSVPLETKDGTWYFFSCNPLQQEVTYSSAPGKAANLRTLTPEQAKEVIAMNERGEKPYTLGGKETAVEEVSGFDYENVVGQDDLTRFDKKRQQNRPQRPDKRMPNTNRDRGNAQRPQQSRFDRDRQNRQNNRREE